MMLECTVMIRRAVASFVWSWGARNSGPEGQKKMATPGDTGDTSYFVATPLYVNTVQERKKELLFLVEQAQMDPKTPSRWDFLWHSGTSVSHCGVSTWWICSYYVPILWLIAWCMVLMMAIMTIYTI